MPTLIALMLSSLSLAQAPQPPATIADACVGRYMIGSEDVLDISVWNNADLTRTVPVRPDGKISLPLVNDVQAAGLTPMELRDSLTKALTQYMPKPTLSVLVREIHSFKVTVIGQVKVPGRYELKDRATVLDVLALAGGLNEFAARDRISVLRQDVQGTRQIPFAYDKITAKDAANRSSKGGANLCVQPGDVILVR